MYKIIGRYRGRSEVLDSASTENEARYLLREYRLAYGYFGNNGDGWQITLKSPKGN